MFDKNILIAGATGLIGRQLVAKLKDLGYSVYILSTTQLSAEHQIYKWDPELKVFDLLPNVNFYAVINLAGASIADTKWDEAGKKLILNSRVNSTLLLKGIINSLSIPPEMFISASAIGYYGLINNQIKNEDSDAGDDFAAQVCYQWEYSAKSMASDKTAISILRIGIVLASGGGFFQKIKNLSKWKIAAALGNGNQPVCWIHVQDLINIFISLLNNSIRSGTYNAVTGTISNKKITQIIAKNNGQPFNLPSIPNWVLKLIFGQKSEIFTQGAEIDNRKILAEGFKFDFDDLEKAIENLS